MSGPYATFKDDTKHRVPTQSLADSIVILCGAVLPGQDRTHFYVAEAPLSPGVNPLLLLIEGLGGRTEFRSVLGVLPRWGIRVKPITSELYRAAFSYVRAKYKKQLTKLESVDLLNLLPAKLVDGRHNGNSIPSWLSERLADFVAEAKENDVSTRLLSPISELLSSGSGSDDDGKWDLLHLDYSEPDSVGDPNWYILERWEDWEKRGLSSADCFAEFRQHHKEPANQNAFNGRLKYLGLSVPLKAGVKRRRERNWRLKQAQREKAEPT